MEMQVFNHFTEAFVERVVYRATGQDEDSLRLVGMRPADHVLAGFLTPASQPRLSFPVRAHNIDGASVEDISESWDDARAIEDLPQDSPYVQSTQGLEWLLLRKVPAQETLLTVRVHCAVYVRTLPSHEELLKFARWQTPGKAHVTANTQKSQEHEMSRQENLPDNPLQQTPIVPVWSRVLLPALTATFDITQILDLGHDERDLSHQLDAGWQAWLQSHAASLYPGMHPILLSRFECTEEGYARWQESAGARARSLASAAWRPILDVRLAPVATHQECVRLSLRVINKTPEPSVQEADYFDPNLYSVQVQAEVPRSSYRYMEFNELPHSYRYERRIAAVGINADVRSDISGESETDTLKLTTESMPRHRVDRLEPREIGDTIPSFEALQRNPAKVLEGILTAMRQYDADVWQAKVIGLTGSSREEAEGDRRRFQEQEIAAFERGLRLLEDPAFPLVHKAFVWMNEAMSKLANGAYDKWRLFQIVFIVAQLPRLAGRHFPELRRDDDDAVDILWFAAGGGKTEAFLGLLIWQMFFDRLRGKTFGTTAMVRFPLRLLAFQQLQRVARALAQAELIRCREGLKGARFSLGYFVGDNTRPNTIDDDRHTRYRKRLPEDELRSLMRCPFCNSHVVLNYVEDTRLIEHLCENREICPGGTDRLPLYIVDSDIYQYLPTVIVSTVDKLALLGQNRRFANLFGRFDLVCGCHGASFRNTFRTCDAAVAFAKNPHDATAHLKTCGGKPVFYGPFVDPSPSLLIQDELHLLSEEMGTFDAHYETAAMEMMRSLGALPWKVIAATATIERFEQHIAHLYLKRARQFPCPGPAAYDSFYYQLDPQRIGRIFVGVLGVGRKHTPTVTRLISLIYQELQSARDLAVSDISLACSRYGLPLLPAKAFERLIFYYELVLTYVLTRKGSDQVAEAIRSRVRRELDELMPAHGDLVLEMFNGGVDAPTMLAAMEEIELAEPETSIPAERIRGVVATNIISHGVDINRFNIIVFGGFTRLVAEYIQASARVGRTFPGISFLVITPQSERDRSIFQRFDKFHEYLDRMVDPSAINRWPVQALERTVRGILSGYLMCVAAQRMGVRIETVQNFQRLLGSEEADPLEEDEVLTWMAAALGVQSAPYPEYRSELELVVRKRYAQLANSVVQQGQYDGLNRFLEAMQSLRDIDDPAVIGVFRKDAQAMLQNLWRA